jgi:uncharacterized membrane protein YoaK (UPF0700 family)
VEADRRLVRPAPTSAQHGDDRLHLALALTLTLGTGVVDAVSYFALEHVFTANMSGNIALAGIGVVTGIDSVAGHLFAFGGFVAGSIAVARFLRRRRASALRAATEALLVELALLLSLTATMGAIDVAHEQAWRFAVCCLLALAMGIQTGIARHLAVADVNTTVATMTLHDLAAASRLAGGNSVRTGRRALVILALLAGAAVGVALDRLAPWGGLAAASAVVGAAIGIAVVRSWRISRARRCADRHRR